jgi:hypothetical protein
MFDAPMTERQLDYLRKVHKPVIARHNISQTHYDLMVGHLVEAMRTNGAQVGQTRRAVEKALYVCSKPRVEAVNYTSQWATCWRPCTPTGHRWGMRVDGMRCLQRLGGCRWHGRRGATHAMGWCRAC